MTDPSTNLGALRGAREPDEAHTPASHVLLGHAARHYGFKNELACKRFCMRHGVPVRRVGKKGFVRIADIEAVIAAAPVSCFRGPPANSESPRVEAAAARLRGRR